MMRLFAFLMAGFLAACSGPQQVEDGRIVLENRLGGNVAQHLIERTRLERSGDPVVLRGKISSAATLFATMDNACLERNVVLGFHRPAIDGDAKDLVSLVSTLVPGAILAVESADEVGVGLFALFLSGEARQKWLTEWSRSEEFTRVTAREFVEMEPKAKLC